MTVLADIVTVFHNETNYDLHLRLHDALAQYEPDRHTFIAVDNRMHNRGFSRGCNLGAFSKGADAPIIGFLNPDVMITGPFLARVEAALVDNTVITGCRYGKADRELGFWGVNDWVCGAAMFVKRDWFTRVGGFDMQFVWSWEETDLIRQAEAQGKRCRSIELPIHHASPPRDSVRDTQYKRHHFKEGARLFYAKWPVPARTGSH